MPRERLSNFAVDGQKKMFAVVVRPPETIFFPDLFTTLCGGQGMEKPKSKIGTHTHTYTHTHTRTHTRTHARTHARTLARTHTHTHTHTHTGMEMIQ